MENILYQLFNGDYDITPERGKKQQKVALQLCEEMDKVQEVFGLEFVNHLDTLQTELDVWYQFQYYRAGFVLGARLMLEALGV